MNSIVHLLIQTLPYAFFVGVAGYGWEQGIPGFITGATLTAGVVFYNQYRLFHSANRYTLGVIEQASLRMALWSTYVEKRIRELTKDEGFKIDSWVIEWTESFLNSHDRVRKGGKDY